MHIYIDESGIFSNPADKPNVASVVAALIVPSANKVRLFREFKDLSSNWPHEDEEIKGKLLDEEEIAATTGLMQKHDCLAEMNVIDLGMHSDEELAEFQKGVCDQIRAWATPDKSQELKERIIETAAALQKPKSPMFVESFLLTVLMPRLLETPMNYYARRLPKEMKSFHWVVDAKQKYLTDFENAWYATIFPSVEHQTKLNPMIKLEGGDYAYLEPYYGLPRELGDRVARELYDDDEAAGLDLGAILGAHFKFEDSKNDIGLQLADVLANATQRALNGRLTEEGYLGIGGLMVLQTDLAIRIIRMDPKAEKFEVKQVDNPFHEPINKMVAYAKPMWLSADQEDYLSKKFRQRKKKLLGYQRAVKGQAG